MLNYLQKAIASHKILVKGCIKIKNQCEAIIGYSLAKTHYLEHNGEYRIIEQLIKDHWLIVDVGASRGDWTSMILDKGRIGQKFILIEPALSAYHHLNEKFQHFRNIELVNMGMGAFTGTMDFYEYSNAHEGSTFVPSLILERPVIRKVNITTIDNYCEENKIEKIDYLKIDCEGFDFGIILGASNMIEHNAISYIQFEYNKAWQMAGATLTACYRFFEKNGYKVYAITSNGLIEWDVLGAGEFFHYANFIAVSNVNHSSKRN